MCFSHPVVCILPFPGTFCGKSGGFWHLLEASLHPCYGRSRERRQPTTKESRRRLANRARSRRFVRSGLPTVSWCDVLLGFEPHTSKVKAKLYTIRLKGSTQGLVNMRFPFGCMYTVISGPILREIRGILAPF